MEKGNQPMPWIHGGILALLLGYRLVRSARNRSRTSPAAS
jgi:hypothetical protein